MFQVLRDLSPGGGGGEDLSWALVVWGKELSSVLCVLYISRVQITLCVFSKAFFMWCWPRPVSGMMPASFLGCEETLPARFQISSSPFQLQSLSPIL